MSASHYTGPLVLIVDDDVAYARLLARRLEVAGLRTHHVETALGVSARLLGEPTVSLVMLDCMMPALTGPAVLELLGKNPRLMTTPVVLMSVLNEYQEAARLHPRCVFVEKTGNVSALINVVLSLLNLPSTPPNA